MATMKDVAKKSGFSVCTVSRALSGKGYLKEETKAKIMAAVEELNYHTNTLAANLKTGRRQTLALILPSLTDVSYVKLQKYMESFASEKGYIIYLINSEYGLEKEKKIIKTVLGMDVAGVIIAPATGEYEHIKKLGDVNIPYVYLNRTFEDDLSHCIRVDNKKATYEAVSYMIKQGHQKIGAIFQSFEDSSRREQYEGMIQALKDNNIPIIKDNIIFDINPEDIKTSNIILKLLQKPNRPEAIFACNDMMAFNVYRAAFVLGLRIPDQLSVFGYDDSMMANFVTPPLSTVSVPVKEIASMAVDFIHNYMEKGTYNKLPILKSSLVIRNSVKKVNIKDNKNLYNML